MTVFVPSCVAHFTLKFDEALQLQIPATAQSVDALVAAGGPRLSFSNPASTRPLVVSKGRESFISNVVPKHASVELPGFRQASHFSMSFDFRQLPIDPRTVRAASVDIHIGSVGQEDFALGMTLPQVPGQTKKSILDTRSTLGFGVSATRVITAIVDEWEVEHDDSSSVITMSGRDLRGVLIDTPLSSAPKKDTIVEALNMALPIDELVKSILQMHPMFEKFAIITNPLEWGARGVPSITGIGVAPRHKRGAKGRKLGGVHTPTAELGKMSFWDLIVQFCYLVGAVPLLIGTELHIRPVRRLYDQQRAGTDPTVQTPFGGGVTRVIDQPAQRPMAPLSVRRMVYGRDIETLSFRRKFSGYQRPRAVRVTSYDNTQQVAGIDKVVSAIYPPNDAVKARKTSAAPGQDKVHEEVFEIAVGGITDTKRLNDIAQAVYEEIGRGEVGGTITTKNLASFGGDNTDPDLCRLRPGDAVEIVTDTRANSNISPLVSENTDHARVPFAKRVAELTELLGDPNLAAVIVGTARGQVQELQRFFRVSNVKYDWTHNTGLKIGFDFQNYIEPRFKADADIPAIPAVSRKVT